MIIDDKYSLINLIRQQQNRFTYQYFFFSLIYHSGAPSTAQQSIQFIFRVSFLFVFSDFFIFLDLLPTFLFDDYLRQVCFSIILLFPYREILLVREMQICPWRPSIHVRSCIALLVGFVHRVSLLTEFLCTRA